MTQAVPMDRAKRAQTTAARPRVSAENNTQLYQAHFGVDY